ncbi:MAG: phosphoribosylformylglycinamidine synthase subunit PurL [Candidatus Dormibacteraeota bacterium]|uniref:Phosphoribosylformylglycinamidine synthase subunit PurL n=1 Tax=Candidatus Amunia macphersoniae TaxID=3127014 RepID=A0A934KKB7_9BACT|nr:phosphoribosylformylglycinamidine synthase subunit PurL [Candidatus Dormibacteraeota bacterium]
MATTAPAPQELAEVALTQAEYELAYEQLNRHPTKVELGIIGALWSEHCGYKTSKPLLKRLPTTGDRVLQGPGENAGAVDIGDGLAAVFKIESHNHPSAIEPYQGAATGVGGILRDIFTMGARPVALLDSLRFGPHEEEAQRHLFDGVVAGIGGYGNCIGVPTVGGEVYFDESYRHNCLVNAMCVGIIEHDKLTRAVASGAGNSLLLVGADTGRDGIHGATFASVQLDDSSEERRPAVQVGNPFLEKCLMEACLELAGDPRVVAMQDLGAAGLTSSTAELAHRGGCGIDIDVDRVSRREQGMNAYEVMLSESQERMLLVVAPEHVAAIQERFARWDLHSDVIGTITDSAHMVIREAGVVVCDLPLGMLIDEVPLRHPETLRPSGLGTLLRKDPLTGQMPWTTGEALLRLLHSPNIGSRRPVFRRYDHQVGDDTVMPPGGDAALVRVRGTRGAIALATDGNARFAVLDPRVGAAIAVCEAARNVVAVGATPLAVTNCLNFGNPEKPEVFWQLQEAIEGIAEACRALDVPVVSGNVSLHNDTNGISIDPTAVIGMVGLIDDVERRIGAGFVADGDLVGVVGPVLAELGGSEYQRLTAGVNEGARPELDLKLERRVQSFVLEAHAERLLKSCHDVSDGGIAVALAESCILGGRGAVARIQELVGVRTDTSQVAGILFGESQSRFLISFDKEASMPLQELAGRHRIPLSELGRTGGGHIHVDLAFDVDLKQAREAYETALV